MGGNRIIPGGICGATPPSERLLGNHGRIEVAFAIGGTCRYPGTVLQWMNSRPLHYVCFLLFPGWYNSDCLFSVPESVHDSQVAEYRNIYNKLEGVFLSERLTVFSLLLKNYFFTLHIIRMNLHFVRELPNLPWVFFLRKKYALLFFEIPFLLFLPLHPKFESLYTKNWYASALLL